MTFVITQNCCNDASCLAACPVDCIGPRPGDPGFATAEMLVIDPAGCIECGACADACPVGAIKHRDALAPSERIFADYNAAQFQHQPRMAEYQTERADFEENLAPQAVQVAVVGTGPSAFYLADEILRRNAAAQVTMIDRAVVPWGLLRHGVAPDHAATKGVADSFRWPADCAGRVQLRLGVEIGRHLGIYELQRCFDAVVYAHGATEPRLLDVPGEAGEGVVPAISLVRWYNGDLDAGDLSLPDAVRRVVVVGNGNVALDVARVLTADPTHLAATDISDRALAVLGSAAIDEVEVLGRRGPEQAAFSTPELIGLLAAAERGGLVVSAPDLEPSALLVRADELDGGDPTAAMRLRLLARIAGPAGSAPLADAAKKIVLRLDASVVEVVREGENAAVGGVRLADGAVVDADLVVVAAGTVRTPFPGLPWDGAGIPHHSGRIAPGSYVVGWAKRGATGVIGSNRLCAVETVAALHEDLTGGRLGTGAPGLPALDDLLRARSIPWIDKDGWARIDASERSAGRASGRPRVKVATLEEVRRLAGMGRERRPMGRRRWPVGAGR